MIAPHPHALLFWNVGPDVLERTPIEVINPDGTARLTGPGVEVPDPTGRLERVNADLWEAEACSWPAHIEFFTRQRTDLERAIAGAQRWVAASDSHQRAA